MKRLLLIPLLALSACATGYHSQGFTGGYRDYMIGPDTASVAVTGNGFTSFDKAEQIWIRRAADITLQHGYRYFVVETANSVPGINPAGLLTPGITSIIRMTNDPNSGNGLRVFDAYYIRSSTSNMSGI